jgi:hypothetical protein
MSWHRLTTVTVMHGRDLSRRRLALAILVALPLAFYFSGRMQIQEAGATADDQLWVLASGAMGTSWAVAVAALFVVNGSRRADQPLLLAGYRAAELLLGRVVTVLVLAALITPAFALLIGSQQEVDVAMLALAIGLGCVASVAIGVVAAALVPRDMEGVLVIIGVVGIQMTVLEPWMPLWGSGELIVRAAGVESAATVPEAVVSSLVATAVLMAVGVLLWARRVRIQPATTILAHRAGEPIAAAPEGWETS